MGRLDGKVAIITGGNSGVGAATAELFSKEGAKVVITARRVPQLEEVASKIRANGGEVLAISCDVSKVEAVEEMVNEYNRRRRLIVSGFNKIGLTCREPKGAFYAFPSIQSTGMTSEEFCEKLLYSKKVAIVPGTAFGKGGEGFVRASYCYSVEHIKEALSRIEEFIKEIKT